MLMLMKNGRLSDTVHHSLMTGMTKERMTHNARLLDSQRAGSFCNHRHIRVSSDRCADLGYFTTRSIYIV